MENSSKAIVIAGSVLIAILLLATGVQVYNSTGKGSAEQAKQASNQMWDGVDVNLGLAERISEKESYIGCYADLDGDKKPDGIIYADLAEGKSGKYGAAEFSYDAITKELKDYYIIAKDYSRISKAKSRCNSSSA